MAGVYLFFCLILTISCKEVKLKDVKHNASRFHIVFLWRLRKQKPPAAGKECTNMSENVYQIDFNKPESVHFIGIGGISMSGLAEILMDEGFTVSGSDAHRS